MIDAVSWAQVVIIVALMLVWPTALIHALVQRRTTWAAVRRSRPLWIGMLAVFGAGVGIVYWARIAPRLRRARRRIAAAEAT